MALVQAKCTNCGANLEVDNLKEAAVCQACGTPFIVEKAINNYNITNNIKADVVNVFSNEQDFVVKGGILTKYNGNSTIISIPNNVKEVNINAFVECSKYIEKIDIPEGVVEFAMQGCNNLKELALPDSLEALNLLDAEKLSILKLNDNIKKVYLYNLGIKEIIFPRKVSSVVCKHCKQLEHISFRGTLENLADDAFDECPLLFNVELPKGLKRIGCASFRGCKSLYEVVFPEGLEEIDGVPSDYDGYGGWGAFSGCNNLQKLTIPDSVHWICSEAFADCRIIEISASEQWKKEHWRDFDCLQSYKPKEGCYIATCVYGSYNCPQVWTLRRYRDNTLAKTWHGRAFIHTYYAISPTIVKWFGNTTWFKKLWRGKLDKMVRKLNNDGVSNAPYEDRRW